ncbi:hypothetical protein FA048_15340 [Pedobacter polaris]|uniref:Uncharacterized protein n=1 Tax=Pedobacter polaris TaxID=2571273 RepID=A0A4U1CIP6_9SPHI|nr:hypothetical protein [Pedobacter polaris]TKC06580.1 hypothetical protein FA048_15340 [Pedobacter polaris]
MENHLTWNKGIFDSNYQLFSNGNIKGSLFFASLKNEARGMGLQNSYLFKTENFLNPTSKILNNKNEVIGTITYDIWHTKAMLEMKSGEQYTWSFINNWYSRWAITDSKEKQISYQASSSSGFIITNTDDEVMLLAGIFIKEFFTRILIAFILFIVLVPIITRSF